MLQEPERELLAVEGSTLALLAGLLATVAVLMAADAYGELLRSVPAFAVAWFIIHRD